MARISRQVSGGGRVRGLMISTLLVVAGCATSSAAPEPAASTPATTATTAGASTCGELPVAVDVPDATAGPVDGPAAEPSPLPEQTVMHWVRPSGQIEVRWPPDERPLYGAPADAAGLSLPWAFDSSSTHPDGVVTLYSDPQLPSSTTPPTPPTPLTVATFTVVAKPPSSRACGKVQVRFISTSGEVWTVGLGLAPLGEMFDLDPLIGPVSDYPGPLPADLSIDCAGHNGRPVDVPVASASPTQAEALRAFLDSSAGAPLDGPSLPRPYHEYRVVSDGSYRFEHFTNWNEHFSISVTKSSQGWAVTSWVHQVC